MRKVIANCSLICLIKLKYYGAFTHNCGNLELSISRNFEFQTNVEGVELFTCPNGTD